MYAAMGNDDPKVIRVLIDAGADVNVRNNDGYTARDLAKQNPNPGIQNAFE